MPWVQLEPDQLTTAIFVLHNKWGHLPVVGTGNLHCPLHSHQPDALWKPLISTCHAPPCRPIRDFRHEKTKKKRGSYLGGAIDPNATFSYKFESDDE